MKTLQLFFALFVLVFASNLDAADEKKAKPFKDVGVEEFNKLRANTNNVVLDVRSEDEYAEGHIPGAVLIDVNGDDFEEKIAKLDKDKTYLVHCAAGFRSARACNIMGKQKFKSLYNLQGGMAAWEKAGKPVEKKK